MGVQLDERIDEMKLALRVVQALIESVDFENECDIALGMIKDQLNDNMVRL